MHSTIPRTLADYREKTETHKVYTFTRKRCACGKQVTARQLELYGQCGTCSKATHGNNQ